MSEPAIVVDNVSKRFLLQQDRASSLKELFTTRRDRNPERGFWAVRDVSLEIPTGTTFGLIGHNGSGKSTLLRLMAGIHQPTRGSITSRGRISALLELGSGFHPDLTGRENIYLNGAMLGLSRKDMHRNLDPTPLPDRRVVIQFLYPELASTKRDFPQPVGPLSSRASRCSQASLNTSTSLEIGR